MRIYQSTEAQAFVETASTPGSKPDLAPGPVVTANFRGFGGCFNELGWKALSLLGDNARDDVLHKLFAPDGLFLDYNRMPIGANDYATSWYSHNETAGDFTMEQFSIERDHHALIPFIKAARKAHGQAFQLFASPWCPPTWLKAPQAYNYGSLIWDTAHRKAYALYFVKFLQAYAAEAIAIQAVHVQNEPDSDQKFPSCLWTGERLAQFIRDDLSPAFKAAGLNTEIWLGTIERGSFNDWLAPTLLDPAARAAISGMGFQWAGKHAVQRARQAAPNLPVIQTENECGDGSNSWAYAHYVFDLMQHYLSNGAEAYVYWNMVLEPKGRSTWGWTQNSLFSVDPVTRVVTENPEYTLMRHIAGFVRPGAHVLATTGRWNANALCFRNAVGTRVVVLQNPLTQAEAVTVDLDGPRTVTLPPKSFTTLVA